MKPEATEFLTTNEDVRRCLPPADQCRLATPHRPHRREGLATGGIIYRYVCDGLDHSEDLPPIDHGRGHGVSVATMQAQRDAAVLRRAALILLGRARRRTFMLGVLLRLLRNVADEIETEAGIVPVGPEDF